jgi:hypothetical protein
MGLNTSKSSTLPNAHYRSIVPMDPKLAFSEFVKRFESGLTMYNAQNERIGSLSHLLKAYESGTKIYQTIALPFDQYMHLWKRERADVTEVHFKRLNELVASQTVFFSYNGNVDELELLRIYHAMLTDYLRDVDAKTK